MVGDSMVCDINKKSVLTKKYKVIFFLVFQKHGASLQGIVRHVVLFTKKF